MQGEKEVFFTCPYCFEQISMVFELYYGTQEYIEDCEVCCAPIMVKYQTDGDQINISEVSKTS